MPHLEAFKKTPQCKQALLWACDLTASRFVLAELWVQWEGVGSLGLASGLLLCFANCLLKNQLCLFIFFNFQSVQTITFAKYNKMT